MIAKLLRRRRFGPGEAVLVVRARWQGSRLLASNVIGLFVHLDEIGVIELNSFGKRRAAVAAEPGYHRVLAEAYGDVGLVERLERTCVLGPGDKLFITFDGSRPTRARTSSRFTWRQK